MKLFRRWSPLILILPALHVCLCLAIASGSLTTGAATHAGGWSWFPMFVLDFPASILLVRLDLGLNHPALIFGIGGTIWWLLVSVALSEAFRLVSLPFRKAALKNRASAR